MVVFHSGFLACQILRGKVPAHPPPHAAALASFGLTIVKLSFWPRCTAASPLPPVLLYCCSFIFGIASQRWRQQCAKFRSQNVATAKLHASCCCSIPNPVTANPPPPSLFVPLLIAVSFVAACAASISDFITFCSKLRIVFLSLSRSSSCWGRGRAFHCCSFIGKAVSVSLALGAVGVAGQLTQLPFKFDWALMHSPHFVELSAYFNALLLWGGITGGRTVGRGGVLPAIAIFGCGLYKFYFCPAASKECTLYNGHGLSARTPPWAASLHSRNRRTRSRPQITARL